MSLERSSSADIDIVNVKWDNGIETGYHTYRLRIVEREGRRMESKLNEDKLVEGSRVRLVPRHYADEPCNPCTPGAYACVGTFAGDRIVKWDNGKVNTYELHQLVLDKPVGEATNVPKDKRAMLDKVILPQGHREAIMEALVQEEHEKRLKMFEQWGFEEGFEKGKGLILLFWGPPGTGKTMCAQAIAEYLQKDFMVLATGDLESSIPGQMERNVRKTFVDAVAKKALVLLDECDSLLYSRNAVGAIMGAQINCLLTEIEKFPGVCVLTTNRAITLDPALERRIALKLEFKQPDKEMRVLIWKSLIPKKCPLAKCVKVEILAEHELAGGNIKNIIFSAARRAIYQKRAKLKMDDFLVAVERELEGMGAFRSKKGSPEMAKEFVSRFEKSNKGGVGMEVGVDVNREVHKVEDKAGKEGAYNG